MKLSDLFRRELDEERHRYVDNYVINHDVIPNWSSSASSSLVSPPGGYWQISGDVLPTCIQPSCISAINQTADFCVTP